MNVYDFDKTIYYPDSSYHFFRFCLRRHPRIVLPIIPRSLVLALRYRQGKCSAKELKEQLFSFLAQLENVDAEITRFWRSHEKNVQEWYLRQRKPDDLIISASPEFLLRPISEKLGFSLIATPMDKQTGKILGENCHDVEKVKRFLAEFPACGIDAFFSDSLSDSPLAEISASAYLVKKNDLCAWPGMGPDNKKE